jgi:hypothetical protein
MTSRSPLRMPRGGAAQVRADLRRFGVRAGAALWGIVPTEALRIAAGLPVERRSSITAVLRRIVAIAEGRNG